jgi:hypothetical protein
MEALLVSLVIKEREIQAFRGELIDNEWICLADEEIEERLSISSLQRKTTAKILDGAGIVYMCRKEASKAYYKINFKVLNVFLNKEPTRDGLGGQPSQNSVFSQWAEEVKKEAGYMCRACFTREGPFEAHHLFSKAYYPEKRLDLNNGICLCESCHKAFHLWNRGCSKPCTHAEFIEWLAST